MFNELYNIYGGTIMGAFDDIIGDGKSKDNEKDTNIIYIIYIHTYLYKC